MENQNDTVDMTLRNLMAATRSAAANVQTIIDVAEKIRPDDFRPYMDAKISLSQAKLELVRAALTLADVQRTSKRLT